MSSNFLARVLVAVPLAVIVVLLAIANLRSQAKLEDLREHGIRVTARIAPGQCSIQGESVYRFAANSRNYEGAGYCSAACQAAPECDTNDGLIRQPPSR